MAKDKEFDINSLTQEGKEKLKNIIKTGVVSNTEIKDIKDSLSESVKAVSEELGMPTKLINMAIKAATKYDLNEQREELDTVDEILKIVGR